MQICKAFYYFDAQNLQFLLSNIKQSEDRWFRSSKNMKNCTKHLISIKNESKEVKKNVQSCLEFVSVFLLYEHCIKYFLLVKNV